ncbi:MAG: hypothetical protein SVW51_10345, partial [Pseudomonadota bacterium]|nr:hypothetical protein [Pseudomonadota bacterium]
VKNGIQVLMTPPPVQVGSDFALDFLLRENDLQVGLSSSSSSSYHRHHHSHPLPSPPRPPHYNQ